MQSCRPDRRSEVVVTLRSRPQGSIAGQYTARHLTCLPHPVSGPVNVRRSAETVSSEPRCLPDLLSGIHLVPGTFHRRHGVHNSPTGSRNLSPCSRGRSTRTMRSTRHDGWVIFSLSVTNLLVKGGIKNTVPVVYVAHRNSLHWSAAATAGIFSLGGSTGPCVRRCREKYCLTSKATTEQPIYWRWPWCALPSAVCGACVSRAARRTTEMQPRQPLTGHDADLG
jgi:hypothetical protein